MDPNLRKAVSHKQPKWTVEQIRAGLEYYKKLHGKYPSSHEIDAFEYLPSSRSIQRSLGGLENMRKALGFDLSLTNLTKGTIRAQKSQELYNQAVKMEEVFYNYLIHRIPEIRVHEHKILRPGHICCDFFIYVTDTNGFAIDIFYAQDIFTLARTVHIKQNRYKDLLCKVYFILVGNQELTQDQIDRIIAKKKHRLPKNIQVLTEKKFMEIFETLSKG